MITQNQILKISKKVNLNRKTVLREFLGSFPISIISSKKKYNDSKIFLDSLIDEIFLKTSGKERKEVLSYIQVLSKLIDEYETEKFGPKE